MFAAIRRCWRRFVLRGQISDAKHLADHYLRASSSHRLTPALRLYAKERHHEQVDKLEALRAQLEAVR